MQARVQVALTSVTTATMIEASNWCGLLFISTDLFLFCTFFFLFVFFSSFLFFLNKRNQHIQNQSKKIPIKKFKK